MRSLKYFFVSCLLTMLFGMFVNTAFAADYYWRVTTSLTTSINTANYSSPSSACDAILGYFINANTSVNWRIENLYMNSPTSYGCLIYRQPKSGGAWTQQGNYGITRNGDACPVGTTYNSATGLCDSPPPNLGEVCETSSSGMPSIIDSDGNCTPFYQADTPASCQYLGDQGPKTFSVYVKFDDQGNPEKPDVEKFGCEVSVMSVAHCKQPAAKSASGVTLIPNGMQCTVAATFTGNVAQDAPPSIPEGDLAGDDEGLCPEGEDCTPEAPVVSESTPCVYVEDAEGRQVCSSSTFTGNPGTTDCGDVNGQFVCVNDPATSTGSTIDTTVETTANADGTSTTKKTDTHEKVVCSGPNSCTTTTTTSTTTTVRNAGGETVSQSAECTGSACSTDGTGDADGDGVDDCAVGEDCDEFTPPEGDDEVPGFGESVQSFMDRVGAAPILASVTAIDVPSGGSCNFPEGQTPIGTISMDSMCDLAGVLDDLHVVFLACWALAAVRVFMSA